MHVSVCHTIGLFVFPLGNSFWESGKTNSRFLLKGLLSADKTCECGHSLV